ncbi:MAG: ester cyclase [Flavobacteriales bacterium]
MLERKTIFTAPFAALLLFASCTGGNTTSQNTELLAHHTAMMKTDSLNKAQETTAKAIYDMVNASGTADIENLVAPDFTDHQADTSLKSTGIQLFKDEVAMFRTAFPDFHQDIMGMATNGDRTYVLLHITGTNTGAWGNMPATGKAIDVMGADVIRFANGKAAEHWGYMEEMKVMAQLGLWPAVAAPAKDAKKK